MFKWKIWKPCIFCVGIRKQDIHFQILTFMKNRIYFQKIHYFKIINHKIQANSVYIYIYINEILKHTCFISIKVYICIYIYIYIYIYYINIDLRVKVIRETSFFKFFFHIFLVRTVWSFEYFKWKKTLQMFHFYNCLTWSV